jgi:hypothetical protein
MFKRYVTAITTLRISILATSTYFLFLPFDSF